MALKESARNEKTLSAHFRGALSKLSSFASSFPVLIETQTLQTVEGVKECKKIKLTFNTQRQLVADSFALRINCATRVIATCFASHFLQHETLIRSNDTSARIVGDDDALKARGKKERSQVCAGIKCSRPLQHSSSLKCLRSASVQDASLLVPQRERRH